MLGVQKNSDHAGAPWTIEGELGVVFGQVETILDIMIGYSVMSVMLYYFY